MQLELKVLSRAIFTFSKKELNHSDENLIDILSDDIDHR